MLNIERQPSSLAPRLWRCALALVLFGSSSAALQCGAGAKQQAIDKTLGAMSQDQRRSNFEDTARVLDQHPEWVDEFYSVARVHGPMMKRFLENAARDLKDRELAALTAQLLANEPASLEQVLVQTIDASKPKPEARKAINRAVAMRADAMSDILTDSGGTLAEVTRALLDVTAKKPKARESLTSAVEKQSAHVVAFAADNPKLMAAMTRPVLEAAVKDKDSLVRLLKELKVL
jgi:hypothetical protein